jgi:hypothetical protein
MRWFVTLSLLSVFTVLALAMEPVSELLPSAPANVNENRGWLRFIAAREKTLTRVTEKPLSMDAQVAALCRLPLPTDLPEANPHRGHFVHVYVTPGQEKTIRTGTGKYPEGTLIVKEKLPNPLSALGRPENESRALETETGKARQPELFTVMLKREAGYNKECGDWEFMVVSGDARQILARGKLDSCIECHQQYKQTDYVTRLYPAEKK